MFNQIVINGSDNNISTIGVEEIFNIGRTPFSKKISSNKDLLILTDEKNKLTDKLILTNFSIIDDKLKKRFGIEEVNKLKLKNNVVKLKFNSDEIDLPLDYIYEVKGDFKIIATFKLEDKEFPAIISKKDDVCFLFDFGELFMNLISQNYIKKETKSLMPSFVGGLYKKLPYKIRLSIYRSYFKKVHKRLKKYNGFKTDFPIDKTGYVLLKLFNHVVKNKVTLISIGRWPKKYKSAIALTHDTEPSVYAYKTGLDEVMDVLEEFNRKSMFTLVGAYVKYINKNTLENLKNYEIGSHGLTHNLNFLSTDDENRNKELGLSKAILETVTNKRVLGIRVPGFQVSEDYFELLEKNGYEYDLSLIDVQREVPHCGGGSSFYLPFYPFINGEKSKILEMGTIAPDCISPYYSGYSMKDTVGLFRLKLEWLNFIRGAGILLIHTPAWGKRDTKLRLYLLKNLLKLTEKEDYWNTTPDELYRWWKSRENLDLVINGNRLYLVNKNNFSIKDVSINIENKNKIKKVFIKKIGKKKKILVK